MLGAAAGWDPNTLVPAGAVEVPNIPPALLGVGGAAGWEAPNILETGAVVPLDDPNIPLGWLAPPKIFDDGVAAAPWVDPKIFDGGAEDSEGAPPKILVG